MSSRKRTSFNVDDIFNDDEKYLFDKYVKIIEVDKEKSEKFKLTRSKTKYVFSKIEELADPIAICNFKHNID
jgi:uncharacterized protein with NAD-binding domain and iron-sulfur cluster